MLVQLPKGKFRIYFRHTNNGSRMWNYSECMIRDEHDKIVAYGQSKCCPDDNFSFAKGRKISLERALSSGLVDFEFSKAERTQIWQQYYREHADLNRKAKVPQVLSGIHV